jgi:UDP-2,4-diacetamido-2,4,6-trideoxy-beta-L-altropyranose hydrolase
VRTLLVSMGGVDAQNETAKTIRAVRMLDRSDLKTLIIVGSSNPHRQEIQDWLGKLPGPSELRVDVTDMAQVMCEADLCVGAGGTTSWERCALGLPTLGICLAENQREILKALEQEGTTIDLGWHADLTENEIAKHLIEILDNPAARKKMSKKGMDLVDGKGASRAAERILKSFG